MSRLTTPVLVLITAVLAALLIAYVFAGGSRAPAQKMARCASPETLAQLKGELFRRAAATRGADRSSFLQVANYAVLRTSSPAVRKRGAEPEQSDCRAEVVLDLPPGLEVVGGRRSLGGSLGYTVQLGDAGRDRLSMLGPADAIVAPLASIRRTGSQTADLVAGQSDPSQVEGATGQMAADESRVDPRPAPVAAPQRAPTVGRPSEAPAKPRPNATNRAPTEPRARTAAQQPKTQPAKTTATAGAPSRTGTSPSFNCRNARTRGEIAVCGDPGLASLDREMARQYYGAVSRASPGARKMLERSRSRFLRYRDNCGSTACMADAYRGRMQEINDIAARF